MMKFVFPVALVIALSSCGDGTTDDVVQEASTEVQKGPLVDLTSEDMALEVELPFGYDLKADDGTVHWNDEFGRMEVNAGENFALTITEEPGDVARFKADLERDLLRSHEVVEENADLLIYRSEYPDDGLVFLHFYQLITVDGREYVIEDMADGKFNEREVRAMSKAVMAKVSV